MFSDESFRVSDDNTVKSGFSSSVTGSSTFSLLFGSWSKDSVCVEDGVDVFENCVDDCDSDDCDSHSH